MNGHALYTTASPLADTIQEGEDIIRRVEEACDRLQFAIRREAETFARKREMNDGYEAAESEELAEVFAAAALKEGPLAGIAKTSKEYDLALGSVRGKLRSGTLRHLATKADDARSEHERAVAERTQAEVEFTALRKIAELKTAILKAATL